MASLGFILSLVMGSLGLYYLMLGKKRAEGKYMLIGAGLILGSYLLF